MNTLSLPMRRLIKALAEQMVDDYLREEALRRKAEDEQRTNPVPLRDMDKAA